MSSDTEQYLKKMMGKVFDILNGEGTDIGLKGQVDLNRRALEAHIELCEGKSNRFWGVFCKIFMLLFRGFVAFGITFIAFKLGWK